MLLQGYPATLGSPFVSNMVGDNIVIPGELQKYYTEKVMYMPYSYHMFNNREGAHVRMLEGEEKAVARAKYGLPESSSVVVFAHFNKLNKLDAHTAQLWMQMLVQVPGSVLWLMRTWHADECVPQLANLANEFGVAAERIVYLDWLPVEEHLQAKSLADVFLDSFDYNAHTTGVDVLIAGVPVVTMPGDKFASRVSASYLVASGLPHLVTHGRKEYEDFVLEHVMDTEKLSAMRSAVRGSKTSGLWDSEEYASHLAGIFKSVWGEYVSNNAR
eukprot:Rmarinus@m.10235